MARYEAGKWPAYNVKAIVGNVERVFKNRDIRKLNNPTYEFITLHMGFIAHYSLYGFQDSYQDLEHFAKNLQTSEYSRDHEYNLRHVARRETDADFDRWYGPAYNKSIAEAIRGIVAIARKYYPGTRGTMPMFSGGEILGGYAEPITAPRPKAKRKKTERTGGQPLSVRELRR